MTYIFDGSFMGLFTALFEAFERREFSVNIIAEQYYQPQFFGEERHISAESAKAQRVLKGLEKHTSSAQVGQVWRAFLSEDARVQQAIFDVAIEIFRSKRDVFKNFGNPKVIAFSQALQKVNREAHRMKAFVRFQRSNDGLFVAVVEPDFNVLPLISTFFKNRYGDQAWLIFDKKRRYGLHYDLQHVTEVVVSAAESKALVRATDGVEVDPDDSHYSQLWQSYFDSTNIKARKNMKLHLRHVPKRYWKYLPEKTAALWQEQ